MVEQKPLPELPSPAVLSVGARQHRARLIRHFLSEDKEHQVEVLRESWAVALEEALDELGRCFAREKWLEGLRRRREQQRAPRKSKQGVTEKAESEHTFDTFNSQNSKIEDENRFDTRDESANKRLQSSKQLPSIPDSFSGRGTKLLLCVSPPNARPDLPSEDSGFAMVPGNISCSFSSGTFVFQDTETPTTLFGNKEADVLGLVGGTFCFQGVTSLSQHKHLFRALRLATYAHLAITLEEYLFIDSNITLTYPRPKLQSPLPSPPTPSLTEEKIKKPTSSFLPASILSFFSPKPVMSHRSKSIMPLIGRDVHHSPSPIPLSRPSVDSGGGISGNFRFSILGSATKPTPPEAPTPQESKTPFTDTLAQIEANAGILSTSPGMRFDPPSLIVDLAAQEKEHSSRRLRGDERLGLTSILGWEGKEHLARGMTGFSGFLRQQGIEVLESRYAPGALSTGDIQLADRAVCGRAKWRTYRYYDGGDGDISLGATIKDLVDSAEAPCDNAGCKHPRGSHETRFIHGGMRISLDVQKRTGEEDEFVSENDGDIEMWESCNACDARSARRKMSDGTYLFSFGKYLELLVYSTTFGVPSPRICPHTDRLELNRHFSTSTYTVSFTCTAVEDIFELRVPRLQMTRGERMSSESTQTDLPITNEANEGAEGEQEKRKLRKEIKLWWEGVADYMDKLEKIFIEADELDASVIVKYKTLPRLPSIDEHYANFGSCSSPKTTGIPSRSTPLGADKPLPNDNFVPETPPRISAPPSTPAQQTPSSIGNPPEVAKEEQHQSFLRLSRLRHTFQRTEQSLYAQLGRTRFATLNDVRCSFMASARGAEKRLCAWQKKHLAGNKVRKDGKDSNEDIAWAGAGEPEWWKSGYHALPGSNVIVKEDDLGSIIAYTLSTSDYQRELTYISSLRQASSSQPTPPVDASPPTTSSFFSAAMSYKLFTSSTDAQPDPDHDDVTWNAPELFSAVISRKEHPRDSANALLSLREVLRHQQKSPALDPLRFGSLGRGQCPPSAWAKPDVQISMSEADGVVSADGPDTAGKILHEFESIATVDSSRPTSRASGSILSVLNNDAASPVETNIHSGKASSVISADSEATTVGREEQAGDTTPKASTAPLPPPKDEIGAMRPRDVSNSTTPSSFTSSLTSGFSNAMKYVLHSTAGNSDGMPRPTSPFPKSPHGLLSLDNAGIDERPHIKYDWTIGKRLKFSCTVYYAKQFDLLRRRCGVDDVFIKSLRHSTNWTADGGKSRSNFWKTSDERFIIKTLVDAWNVADLQVLIDLAPSYFRYIDSTTSKATVLAKMMGFYTIEIRNLETGNVQSKADLLVMENLFYNQKIGRTFDLKGIQGRKVKPSNGVKVAQKTQTLFDGEWIEGQQKALMLIRPHSKQVLRAAIRSDAEFLAKSNIMDYSLLIGVNEQHKEITCGLVDTIGSYTFAKTLEYKAKQGLNSGKEVTVIPPAEYQERFVSALEGYFLACPDKWSKPMDESKIISDVNLLPSVL